jgi:hypothetical protein
MPGANAAVTQQLEATRKLQQQNAIAQAGKVQPQNVAAQAQAAGVQAAAQQGQARATEQQQNLQGQQEIRQAMIQDRAQEETNAARLRGYENTKVLFEAERRLENLDSRLKQDIYDKQLQFKEDEIGNTMFDERQLLDYKIATAKDDNDLLAYEQQVEQASRKKQVMLDVALRRIKQELANDLQGETSSLSREQRIALGQKAQALQDKIRKEQNKSKNRAAMFQAGGQILGAVAGAVVGTVLFPGVGTAAGATAGAAIGSGAGAAVAGSTKV